MNPFLLKQYFQPTPILGMLFNPFYIARRALWKKIQMLGKHIQGKTLDIGCGSKPYEKCFLSTEYIGLEIHNTINLAIKKVDVFYEGKKIPFENETFDSVVCFQVLEHVFEPEEFLNEIYRILKPGGKLLLTVPFVWDEHEQPYDYARYSSFGLTYLLQKHHFQILEHHKTVQNAGVIVQLTAEYFYKLAHNVKILKYLTMLFVIFPIICLGSLCSTFLPNNPDLFLDNVILAQKIE
jgi:SAM-dependent methyltransferase